jgi:hypothetical protein
MSSRKFNPLADRIEFNGSTLVNSMRPGHCAQCDEATFWYDLILRKFLCGEECAEREWGIIFEQAYRRYK